jgi:hypothetical protein
MGFKGLGFIGFKKKKKQPDEARMFDGIYIHVFFFYCLYLFRFDLLFVSNVVFTHRISMINCNGCYGVLELRLSGLFKAFCWFHFVGV